MQPSIKNALEMLVTQVNSNNDLLPGATVHLEFLDTMMDMTLVIGMGLEALKNTTHGVLGEFNSASTEPLSYVLQRENVMQCSGASTATTFTDKKKFPNFYRTIPPDDEAGAVMINYAASMSWTRVAILAANNIYGQAVADAALVRASQLGIQIVARAGFTIGTQDYSVPLQNIKSSNARIIVFCGAYEDMTDIFLQAAEAGLVGEEYVWIGGESTKDFPYYFGGLMPEKKYLTQGMKLGLR